VPNRRISPRVNARLSGLGIGNLVEGVRLVQGKCARLHVRGSVRAATLDSPSRRPALAGVRDAVERSGTGNSSLVYSEHGRPVPTSRSATERRCSWGRRVATV